MYSKLEYLILYCFMLVLSFGLFLTTLYADEGNRVIGSVFTLLASCVLLITWLRFPVICYFEKNRYTGIPSLRYLLEALGMITSKEIVLFISILLCTYIFVVSILIII